MGFTGSLGNPELNQELSLRRAIQVFEAPLAADPKLADKVTFYPWATVMSLQLAAINQQQVAGSITVSKSGLVR